jgi:hypothetical protein
MNINEGECNYKNSMAHSLVKRQAEIMATYFTEKRKLIGALKLVNMQTARVFFA